MDEKYIKIIIYLGLFLLAAINAYRIIKFWLDNKITKIVIDNFEESYDKRCSKSDKQKLVEGNIEETNILRSLDIMINRSGIREKYSFFTTEVFITLTIMIVISTYFLSKFINNYWGFNLLISMFAGLACYFSIYYLSGISYEKIDSQITNFINYLENFATTNVDIVTIIEKTAFYMEDPLKSYLEKFVTESRQGKIKLAFQNLADKIENVKFQQLIKNLEIASRHEANYKEVVSESRIILKGYFKNKEKRKELIRNGRIELAMMLLISTLVLKMVTDITPNLANDIFTTTEGAIFVVIGIVLIGACIWLFLRIDRG